MGPVSASLGCFPFLSHLRLPFWPPHQKSVAEIWKAIGGGTGYRLLPVLAVKVNSAPSFLTQRGFSSSVSTAGQRPRLWIPPSWLRPGHLYTPASCAFGTEAQISDRDRMVSDIS